MRYVDETFRPDCAGQRCPAVIGDILVYRNSGHITATYTATMTPWLARRIPALPAIAGRRARARGLDPRPGC